MLMGSAAGLGSLPFFFVGSLSKEWSALANALACGVMLACSFDLVHEGQPYGGGSVILGIILGRLHGILPVLSHCKSLAKTSSDYEFVRI